MNNIDTEALECNLAWQKIVIILAQFSSIKELDI